MQCVASSGRCAPWAPAAPRRGAPRRHSGPPARAFASACCSVPGLGMPPAALALLPMLVCVALRARARSIGPPRPVRGVRTLDAAQAWARRWARGIHFEGGRRASTHASANLLWRRSAGSASSEECALLRPSISSKKDRALQADSLVFLRPPKVVRIVLMHSFVVSMASDDHPGQTATETQGKTGGVGQRRGSHQRQHVSMPPRHGGRTDGCGGVGRARRPTLEASRRRANGSSLAGIALRAAAGGEKRKAPPGAAAARAGGGCCNGPCSPGLAPSERRRTRGVRGARRGLLPESPSPTRTGARRAGGSRKCARRALRTRLASTGRRPDGRARAPGPGARVPRRAGASGRE